MLDLLRGKMSKKLTAKNGLISGDATIRTRDGFGPKTNLAQNLNYL